MVRFEVGIMPFSSGRKVIGGRASETIYISPTKPPCLSQMANQLYPYGRDIWNAATGNQYVRRIHIAELVRVLREQSSR